MIICITALSLATLVAILGVSLCAVAARADRRGQ